MRQLARRLCVMQQFAAHQTTISPRIQETSLSTMEAIRIIPRPFVVRSNRVRSPGGVGRCRASEARINQPRQQEGFQMKWLLDYVDSRISTLFPRMFASLSAARTRRDLGWIHQLPHMSRGFIQALCIRVGCCGRGDVSDLRFYRDFTRHAKSEISHPPQLQDWMQAAGFSDVPGRPEFCGVPATPDTASMVLHCWEVAENSPADEQVVMLNVVLEGVAYRFFTAATEAIARVGLSLGRFWSDHGDDLAHARIGVDKIGEVEAASDQGRRLLAGADLTLGMIDLTLDSWAIGAPAVDLDLPDLPSAGRVFSARGISIDG